MGKVIFIYLKNINLLGNPKLPLFLLEEEYININSILIEIV